MYSHFGFSLAELKDFALLTSMVLDGKAWRAQWTQELGTNKALPFLLTGGFECAR